MTLGLANELRGNGIAVNCMKPVGGIETPDNYTVRFVLKEPRASFLARAAAADGRSRRRSRSACRRRTRVSTAI